VLGARFIARAISRCDNPCFRSAESSYLSPEVSWWIAGSGPAVLLLHGFTGAGAWWDPVFEALAEDYTTIVPDLPGHGYSQARDGAYRYPAVAGDLYALMDELGFGRFRAIGYSAGGIILLHMATQQPNRIESMALLSTVHVLPEAARPMLANWPSFENSPTGMRDYWLGIHPGGEEQVRGLLESLRGLGEVAENMRFTPEQLSAIEARTLLVVGDRDDLVPLDLALEMYGAIPDAALWVVPQQGHSAVWPDWGGSAEAASIFPDVVTRFLGSEALQDVPGQ
jgi:pimeloyl-ACP methyl ester carboxylesterase